MRILALDAATKTGWAIGDSISEKVKDSGVFTVTGSCEGEKFHNFGQWLNNKIALDMIDVVAYERYVMARGRSINLLSGLRAMIEESCWLFNARPVPYSASTIKKHATGNGKATKHMMMDAAEAKWKNYINILDDNHADALWLLDLAKKT